TTPPATKGVLSHDLTLTASAGIGSADQPFAAALTTGGTLTARGGNDGVYLNLNSGALVNQVSANTGSSYGDVVISAAAHLAPETGLPTGTVNIAGNSLTLSGTSGNVGSPTGPLVIGTHGTPQIDGSVLGGVLNVTALNNIGLVQNSGDLLVNRVVSTGGGDVYLNATAGSIYNVTGQTAASTLSSDQIQQVWADLHLKDSSFAQGSVTAFQNQVVSEHRQYWE